MDFAGRFAPGGGTHRIVGGGQRGQLLQPRRRHPGLRRQRPRIPAGAHRELEILADKEITVISVNDSIEIKASKKIVLQAGQSSITLDGG
ncbi:hypothetical protein ASC94_10695, partial [Massilia sp. Root418]